jgi:hypothetical protein
MLPPLPIMPAPALGLAPNTPTAPLAPDAPRLPLVPAGPPAPESDAPAIPFRPAPPPAPGAFPVELLSPQAIAMSTAHSAPPVYRLASHRVKLSRGMSSPSRGSGSAVPPAFRPGARSWFAAINSWLLSTRDFLMVARPRRGQAKPSASKRARTDNAQPGAWAACISGSGSRARMPVEAGPRPAREAGEMMSHDHTRRRLTRCRRPV